MKYFKQNNEVYAYDAEQLEMGYGKDMTPMTDEEVELHIHPIKTEAQLLLESKAEAQAYLDSTDWYVTRKFERAIEIPIEVQTKRAAAIKVLN